MRLLACCSVFLVLAPGCAWMRGKEPLEDSVAAIGLHASAETRSLVESEVMDFADQYILKVAQAMDELRDRVGTPEARAQAQAWKVSHGNAVLITATNPNSFVGLLDLIVLVTLGRMVVEEDWVGRYGDVAQPIVDVYREQEESIWKLSREYVTPAQEQDVRELIQAWRAENPKQRYIAMVRLRDFARGRRNVEVAKKKRFDSLFDLLYIDPLSNLDPAVKEIEQARSMVNRVLFQLHRSPNLLSWQVELLVYKLLRTPELKTWTNDVDRVTAVLESTSDTLKELPAEIHAERRSVVEAFEANSPILKGLVGELHVAFSQGHELARSVELAAQAIRDLIPEKAECEADSGTAPKESATESADSGDGFDVKDYGAAAAEISNASDHLLVLTSSLERLINSAGWEARATNVRAAIAEARAEGARLLRYAFFLGVGLILILACAALAVTVAARRMVAPRPARVKSAVR